ncbi:MAG TPA: hypothetical protein VEC17_02305 [Candidatus Binatia bacterium]|nr:hypothetical protein [Candidatus Binatia bacterium]
MLLELRTRLRETEVTRRRRKRNPVRMVGGILFTFNASGRPVILHWKTWQIVPRQCMMTTRDVPKSSTSPGPNRVVKIVGFVLPKGNNTTDVVKVRSQRGHTIYRLKPSELIPIVQ